MKQKQFVKFLTIECHHIGVGDPRQCLQFSQEGRGLHISTHPHALDCHLLAPQESQICFSKTAFPQQSFALNLHKPDIAFCLMPPSSGKLGWRDSVQRLL